MDNISSVTNKDTSEELINFLSTNLPVSKKKASKSFSLGVMDKHLAKKIAEDLNVKVEVGSLVLELSRVIRFYFHKFLKINEDDVLKSQLGLGHQYSRSKCMYDVNREDKPVIQSIALIDQLDKNINSFCMRIKEWYGWHFPELNKLVSDNALYVRVVNLIQTRNQLQETEGKEDDALIQALEEILADKELVRQVYEASCSSVGSDLNEIDTINVKYFCDKVSSLINYREGLGGYLKDKMKVLAPNTSTLVGETLSARLISHAGSLSNLAKYPASTIQILGAEKALFRALKARSGKTPKYGLLYHSNYIGKSLPKNKGKISRYLANKIAQSSRIDFFSESRESLYGEEFKKQVDERMKYLIGGTKPRKNVEVMKEVKSSLADGKTNGRKSSRSSNKKKAADLADDSDEEEEKQLLGKKRKNSKASKASEKKSKSKKSKKKKVESDSDDE